MNAHARIRAELSKKITDNKAANKLKFRGDFLGINDLKETLTIENIRALLREDFSNDMNNDTLEEWCIVIRDRRRKSYTILLLEDRANAITQLDKDDRALDDEALYDQPFLTTEPYQFPWRSADPSIAQILETNQWIIPTKLSSQVHQTFPAQSFRFPFIREPKMVYHGSFGQVYEIKIAEGNLEFTQGYDQNSAIVYKTVRKEENKNLGWPRLLNEVRTLRARKHPHIMPLLSSFSAGDAKSFRDKNSQENLYMILPQADGNMEDWIHTDRGYFNSLESRRKSIYQIMIDVTSGLAYIHREIKGSVGHHHDLKPENILHFSNPGSQEPIWKICDFGGANLKDAVGETGTSFVLSTPLYAPPEYKDGSKHGRAFDMWSLGCILLELATVWKYGWTPAGMDTLAKLRIEEGEKKDPRYPRTYQSNRDVIQRWIYQLSGDDSKDFGKVVGLIEEMLVDRYQRIFSWEAEIDLLWIIKGTEESNKWIMEQLRVVAQSSRKPVNAITKSHNPLTRAIRLGRPKEFQMILRERYWSDNDPGSTEMLQVRSRPEAKDGAGYFSTLVIPEDSSPLYGRHEEIERIERSFTVSNTVGLYGLGGIGKSHLALHYALQFKEAPSPLSKKHTFLVSADSKSSIIDSYEDIALAVGLSSRLEPTHLCTAVKNWLEDETRGPWIMVVDGLDSLKTALDIKDLLPRCETGQLLVTARNSTILERACGLGVPCLKIEKPEPQDCLKIFRRHLAPSYYDEDAQGTGELLERLWLPLVIKMAAGYMNKLHVSNQIMCEEFEKSGLTFDHIAEFDRTVNVMKLFLKPLFEPTDSASPPEKSDRWPEDLRLLCFLACLSKDKVGVKLIRANYPPATHAIVNSRLAMLCNGAFLEKVDNETYRMHKFVQDALISWIREQRDEDGLFKWFEGALGALLKRYEEKKRDEHKDRAILMHRSSYSWKTPFMPHFARFVEHTHHAKSRGLSDSFRFDPRAIESITTFSQLYLDEGRPQAAIEVLEFANEHADKSKLRLGKTLAQAYMSRAILEQRRQDWTMAATLLKSLIKEADETSHDIMKWELQLDLIRLFGQSNRCAIASKELHHMWMFQFRERAGHVELVHPKSLAKAIPQYESIETKVQMIIIRKRFEEGLVHLATGRRHLENRQSWRAPWAWRRAKQAFSDAKRALEEWLREEREFLVQIEGSIADVNYEIGTKELLEDAENVLRDHIDQLQTDFGVSDKRVWDTKFRLAAVCLKGKDTKAKEAVDILKRITDSHKGLFGRENSDTRKYASLLREAYLKTGLKLEAKQLEVEFTFDAQSDDAEGTNAWKQTNLQNLYQLVVIVFVPSIFVVFLLILRRI